MTAPQPPPPPVASDETALPEPQARGRGGRPCLYPRKVEPFLDTIRAWAEQGACDNEIAALLGVSERSFAAYKRKFPQLLRALRAGGDVATAEVVAALHRSAVGFESIEYKRRVGVTATGEVNITETVTKQIAGDVTAQVFWLVNKAGGEWRNVRQIAHDHSVRQSPVESEQDKAEALFDRLPLDKLEAIIAAEMAADEDDGEATEPAERVP